MKGAGLSKAKRVTAAIRVINLEATITEVLSFLCWLLLLNILSMSLFRRIVFCAVYAHGHLKDPFRRIVARCYSDMCFPVARVPRTHNSRDICSPERITLDFVFLKALRDRCSPG